MKIARGIFYFWLFLLPWQVRYFWPMSGVGEYATYSLFLTDLMFVIWVGLAVWFGWRERWRMVWTRTGLFLGLFLLLMALSIWPSKENWFSLYYLTRFIAAGSLIFWVPVIRPRWSWVSWSLIASGLIQALFGLAQFILQQTWSSKWLGLALHPAGTPGTSVVEIGLERWLRAYGAFPHPNVLGGFLVLVSVITISYYFYSSHRNERLSLYLFAAYVVLLAGLIVTFSRSAWLAWLVSAAVFGVWAWRHRNFRFSFYKIAAVSLVVWLFFGLVWSPLFSGRFNLNNRLESRSITERQFWNQQGWRVARDHWVGGVGMGQSVVTVRERLGNSWPVEWFQPAHSIYILSWSEIGIGVFAVWLVLIAWSLRQLWQSRRLADPIGLGFRLHLIIFLLIGFFDHYLWSLPVGVWMLGVALMNNEID